MDQQPDAIQHTEIPDNSVTIILKAQGIIYSTGATIGLITPDTPDEDLNSVLRALNGMGITLQKTVAQKLADRDETYNVPGNDPEQDLTSLADRIAEIDVEKSAEANVGQDNRDVAEEDESQA